MASAGMGTADALRAAQLSMRRALRRGTFTVDAPAGRIAPREHPLFWAGFLLVGEP